MTDTRYVQKQDDGSWIDWGRHGPSGTGGAVLYAGEDAKVIDLLMEKKNEN